MAVAVVVSASYGAVTWGECRACLRDTAATATTYALMSTGGIKPLSIITYCPACGYTETRRLPP